MTTLDEIVNLYLDEADLSDRKYARAYRLGLRCWKSIHRNYTGDPVAFKLEVLSNNTAILPDDFVNDLRVGVVNNKGEMVAFRKNDQLTPYKANCSDRLGQTTEYTQIDTNVPFDNALWIGALRGGSTIGSLGIGSDNEYGSYKILKEEGLIIFDFNNRRYSGDVILEYIPALSCEGDYLVHEAFEEAIINYLKWKMNDSNRNISRGDKNQWRRDYYITLKRGIKETRGVNIHDIYANYRRNVRSAPKA